MNTENKTAVPDSRCRKDLGRAMKSTAWLAAVTGVYLVGLFLERGNPGWSPGLRVTVALAPLVPGVFYLRDLLHSFRAMDELQQRVQLEAWAIALAGTVVVSTTLNVLNAHGLGPAGYAHGLQIGGTYLTMFLLWCAGVSVANFRYR